MNYEEFNAYKEIRDTKNPFAKCYQLESGEIFYIEPIFYTHLMGFKDHHHDKYQLIIDRMIEVVKKNKKVVFVGTFDFPQTEVSDDFIFLEINDITDPLMLFVEDKSRGSDYGD